MTAWSRIPVAALLAFGVLVGGGAPASGEPGGGRRPTVAGSVERNGEPDSAATDALEGQCAQFTTDPSGLTGSAEDVHRLTASVLRVIVDGLRSNVGSDLPPSAVVEGHVCVEATASSCGDRLGTLMLNAVGTLHVTAEGLEIRSLWSIQMTTVFDCTFSQPAAPARSGGSASIGAELTSAYALTSDAAGELVFSSTEEATRDGAASFDDLCCDPLLLIRLYPAGSAVARAIAPLLAAGVPGCNDATGCVAYALQIGGEGPFAEVLDGVLCERCGISVTSCQPPPPPTRSRSECNQGIGNGAEGCDPGNSNRNHLSNDEEGRKPGDAGPRPKSGGGGA